VTYVVVAPNQPYKQGVHQGYGTTSNMGAPVHQDQNSTWNNDSAAVVGSSSQHEGHGAVPPTYAEAVKGDHKVQTAD